MNSVVIDIKEDKRCAYCAGTLLQPNQPATVAGKSITCGHLFHKHCVKLWLDSRESVADQASKICNCPICTTKINATTSIFLLRAPREMNLIVDKFRLLHAEIAASLEEGSEEWNAVITAIMFADLRSEFWRMTFDIVRKLRRIDEGESNEEIDREEALETLEVCKEVLFGIEESETELIRLWPSLTEIIQMLSIYSLHGATPSDTCDYERMCEARVTAAIASTTASCNSSMAPDMTTVIPPPPQQPIISFAVEPAALVFPAAGGNSSLTLTNSGDGKIMYKIKPSNNKEYIIKPAYGFIDGKVAAHVQITRLPGAAKEEKLTIQFAPAPEGAANAQEAFKGARLTGEVTIPCKATEFKVTSTSKNAVGTTASATTESTTKTSTTTSTSKAPPTTKAPTIADGVYCIRAICKGEYFGVIKSEERNDDSWDLVMRQVCDWNSHWRIIGSGEKILMKPKHSTSQEYFGYYQAMTISTSWKEPNRTEWTPIKNDDGSWTFYNVFLQNHVLTASTRYGPNYATHLQLANHHEKKEDCQKFNLEPTN